MHVKDRIRSRHQSSLIRRVQSDRLTYLSTDRLESLRALAQELDDHDVPGDFVECGVALGGSAVVLAAMLRPDRRLHAYDVFGTIPPPSAADPPEVHERYRIIAAGQSEGIGGDGYYGYRQDLEQHVARTLARFGYPVGAQVQLHRGLFDEALRLTHSVALAHIDCDWHDPVDICLRRIGPWLSPGGYMVLDDYNDYGGCRSATDRYVAETPGMELIALETNAAVRRTH